MVLLLVIKIFRHHTLCMMVLPSWATKSGPGLTATLQLGWLWCSTILQWSKLDKHVTLSAGLGFDVDCIKLCNERWSKVHPRIDHEGPEGEQRYSSTLPWTSAPDPWAVNATPLPLYPQERPGTILQDAGWAPGPVWTGAENLIPNGIQSLYHPACTGTIQTMLSWPKICNRNLKINNGSSCYSIKWW
jgi:hypothetical protein